MQNESLNPRFFFLSLGVIVTLIATVSSFLVLSFEIFNIWLPDVSRSVYTHGYDSYMFARMRGALATLLIVSPLLIVISAFWEKQIKTHLGRIDRIIYTWLLYLILFLAGIVVVVDFVTLVQSFVAGELTLRFGLKVLTVLLVSFIGGTYYTLHLRKKKISSRLFAITTLGLVLISVFFAFTLMGSPATQRKLRIDQKKINDLQSIQWQVIGYFQQKESLPEKLSDVQDMLSGYKLPVSPDQHPYEYMQTGDMTFNLCTTFNLPRPEGWHEYVERPYYGDMAVSEPAFSEGGWDHEGGYTCFEREIDPDIYKPYE